MKLSLWKNATIILGLMILISVAAACSNNAEEVETSKTETKKEEAPFVLTSSAFEDGGEIQLKYTKSDQNVSVPLAWTGVPSGTKAMALYMDDLHPVASGWQHWIVVNLPADAESLTEGVSGTDQLPTGSIELKNSFGTVGYGGPQPPSGSGVHEYHFTLYALDTDTIEFPEQVSPALFNKLIEEHVIGKAELSGMFENK